uniref:bis(5'-nucleosyl)-tetraphosphatase (symmetrical) n=1 Tax=mine drainage metagenome TaxID=410659 RepID=E6QUP5_9ZZZZ
MSSYAIGDLQGCFGALILMLERIRFNPQQDKIFLLGDLVNRGLDSLKVLRWARDHHIHGVLGNHDLHLLSLAEGYTNNHSGDTLQAILDAPDRHELLYWLRHLPLARIEQGYLLVHAGVLPQWTVAQTLSLSQEVESALQGTHYRNFLQEMYGNLPDRWDDSLTGISRLRVIANAMTRLRFCTPDGTMDFKSKGDPQHAPAGYLPWFQVPERRTLGTPIIFGHWSALGLQIHSDSIALDTGCLWGGKLSAIRLEDQHLFQIDCAGLAGTKRLR